MLRFALRRLLIVLLLLNVLACESETQQATSPIAQQTIEEQQAVQIEPENKVMALEEVIEEKITPEREVNIEQEYKPEKEVQLVPIEVTKDDDDLKNDSDDLPAEVELHAEKEREEVQAYAFDYDTEENNLLDEAENAARGIEEDEEEEESSSAVITRRPKGTEIFFVVAGVYKDEVNAKKKMNTLINLGYTPELTKFDSQFHTVCISKLRNRKKADKLVTELEELYELDAYVVKRRQ